MGSQQARPGWSRSTTGCARIPGTAPLGASHPNTAQPQKTAETEQRLCMDKEQRARGHPAAQRALTYPPSPTARISNIPQSKTEPP